MELKDIPSLEKQFKCEIATTKSRWKSDDVDLIITKIEYNGVLTPIKDVTVNCLSTSKIIDVKQAINTALNKASFKDKKKELERLLPQGVLLEESDSSRCLFHLTSKNYGSYVELEGVGIGKIPPIFKKSLDSLYKKIAYHEMLEKFIAPLSNFKEKDVTFKVKVVTSVGAPEVKLSYAAYKNQCILRSQVLFSCFGIENWELKKPHFTLKEVKEQIDQLIQRGIERKKKKQSIPQNFKEFKWIRQSGTDPNRGYFGGVFAIDITQDGYVISTRDVALTGAFECCTGKTFDDFDKIYQAVKKSDEPHFRIGKSLNNGEISCSFQLTIQAEDLRKWASYLILLDGTDKKKECIRELIIGNGQV